MIENGFYCEHCGACACGVCWKDSKCKHCECKTFIMVLRKETLQKQLDIKPA